MFLTEAIFELPAEKGILTGEEVKERVKKLKSETNLQFRCSDGDAHAMKCPAAGVSKQACSKTRGRCVLPDRRRSV
jgi:hypothetical protein